MPSGSRGISGTADAEGDAGDAGAAVGRKTGGAADAEGDDGAAGIAESWGAGCCRSAAELPPCPARSSLVTSWGSASWEEAPVAAAVPSAVPRPTTCFVMEAAAARSDCNNSEAELDAGAASAVCSGRGDDAGRELLIFASDAVLYSSEVMQRLYGGTPVSPEVISACRGAEPSSADGITKVAPPSDKGLVNTGLQAEDARPTDGGQDDWSAHVGKAAAAGAACSGVGGAAS